MLHTNNHGFTMLELMIVLVIVGILCSLGVANYTKMAATAELDKAAWAVFKDLASVRPLSMKVDQRGKVVFKNREYIVDKYSSFDTLRLPEKIGFAKPSGGLSVTPFGGGILSDSGANGLWRDSLIVRRDAIGTIDSGFVIVSSAKLSNMAFYIGVSGIYQNLQIYKWIGNSWIKQ